MKIPNHNRGIIPFLILVFIAILIAFFAMGFFTEQRPFGLKNYEQILNLDCGLTLYAPKADAEIAFPYKIYGYANGCDWEPVDGIIGTATILASNGLVLGKISLPASNIPEGKPYYFEATIDIPVSFFNEDGMVLIQNLLPGLQNKFINIPVHFVSHL